MHSYCRAMGIKEAFNMYQYKNLQAQQSESPQSIAQLARLLEALLGVSSSAKIKYKALKQFFVVLLQTWGRSFSKPAGRWMTACLLVELLTQWVCS